MADTVEYGKLEETLFATAEELLATGDVGEALEVCTAVLQRKPSEPAALALFARAAERADLGIWEADAPTDESQICDSQIRRLRIPGEVDGYRRRVVQLVEAKHYEGALLVLLQGRRRFPNDEAIARSIEVLRDRLEARYLRRLGPLSRIPTAVRGTEPQQSDLSTLHRLIDGRRSIEELLRRSGRSRFHTLRALHRLVCEGYARVRDAGAHPPAPFIASSDRLSRTALMLARAQLASERAEPAPASATRLSRTALMRVRAQLAAERAEG